MDLLFKISGYVSGILMLIAFVPYISDILKRKTKPERASWLIWGALGSVALFSQASEGATYSLVMTATQTVGDFLIFILALKFGLGSFEKRDYIALVFIFLTLVVWYLTNNPALAIYLTILIDGTGGVLTALKSYEDPGSETESAWLLNGISGVLASVAVGVWSPSLLAFPVYIAVINFAILFAIRLGKRKFSS